MEINSQVWRSFPRRKRSGNRLNWRQAPFARASCVLCRLPLRPTAWIVNAARAALSGVCLPLHLLPAGKEVDQHILRCNRRICRGKPNPRLAQMLSAPVRPNFLERRRHQEPVTSSKPYESECKSRIQPTDISARHDTGIWYAILRTSIACRLCTKPSLPGYATVAGLSLHRWVRRTEWTTKKQIDQCPTHVIPLHSVLYQGWNSY